MYGSNNNKQKNDKFKYNSVSILVMYSGEGKQQQQNNSKKKNNEIKCNSVSILGIL